MLASLCESMRANMRRLTLLPQQVFQLEGQEALRSRMTTRGRKRAMSTRASPLESNPTTTSCPSRACSEPALLDAELVDCWEELVGHHVTFQYDEQEEVKYYPPEAFSQGTSPVHEEVALDHVQVFEASIEACSNVAPDLRKPLVKDPCVDIQRAFRSGHIPAGVLNELMARATALTVGKGGGTSTGARWRMQRRFEKEQQAREVSGGSISAACEGQAAASSSQLPSGSQKPKNQINTQSNSTSSPSQFAFPEWTKCLQQC